MRKIVLIISILVVVVMLSSCAVIAKPIENPNLEKFEELFVSDEYTVWIKSEIYRAEIYTMEGYGFGHGDDTCSVGSYERTNYLFLYKDEYYDIVEFNKFRLISCDDLSEIGVQGLHNSIDISFDYSIEFLSSIWRGEHEFSTNYIDDEEKTSILSQLNHILQNAYYFDTEYDGYCNGGGDRVIKMNGDSNEEIFIYNSSMYFEDEDTCVNISEIIADGESFGYIDFEDYLEIIELLEEYYLLQSTMIEFQVTGLSLMIDNQVEFDTQVLAYSVKNEFLLKLNTILMSSKLSSEGSLNFCENSINKLINLYTDDSSRRIYESCIIDDNNEEQIVGKVVTSSGFLLYLYIDNDGYISILDLIEEYN